MSRRALRPPPAISPGARIAVVAPGSPVARAALSAGMRVLRGWGYEPVAGRSLRAKSGDLAGDDQLRAADLEWAFHEPGLEAVWCGRGGWGAARLLDRLDLRALARQRRPLIGFSDVTALHDALTRHGAPCWHAPLVADLGRPERYVAADLRRMLDRPGVPRIFRPGTRRRVVGGRARGWLGGGCLSVLASLCGTPHQPDLRGAVVVLEDVGEAPYRIDRLLWQLRESGALRGVRGLAFGQFTGCRPPRGRPSRSVADVLREHAATLGVPALAGLPFGHGRKARAVPLGVAAELDADRGLLAVPPTE